MQMKQLTMNALFAQLGLANSDEAIVAFLDANPHARLSAHLHESPIWNASQAAFLRQAILDDADWCNLVDQLDARLRKGATK
ncbi:MAG TPA: DUF2789 family protein [Hyphomicrobiales bacterium]|nr:DUF2789 family protein [Hyphomicrobiales bacterium]